MKKKNFISLENYNNSEIENLKIIKQNNEDLEDKELIDACFQKHYFLRNIISEEFR